MATEQSKNTDEIACKTHPDAPHGFLRGASHGANRYVCECESWEPDEPKENIKKESL